jgi:hypothetical protein
MSSGSPAPLLFKRCHQLVEPPPPESELDEPESEELDPESEELDPESEELEPESADDWEPVS